MNARLEYANMVVKHYCDEVTQTELDEFCVTHFTKLKDVPINLYDIMKWNLNIIDGVSGTYGSLNVERVIKHTNDCPDAIYLSAIHEHVYSIYVINNKNVCNIKQYYTGPAEYENIQNYLYGKSDCQGLLNVLFVNGCFKNSTRPYHYLMDVGLNLDKNINEIDNFIQVLKTFDLSTKVRWPQNYSINPSFEIPDIIFVVMLFDEMSHKLDKKDQNCVIYEQYDMYKAIFNHTELVKFIDEIRLIKPFLMSNKFPNLPTSADYIDYSRVKNIGNDRVLWETCLYLNHVTPVNQLQRSLSASVNGNLDDTNLKILDGITKISSVEDIYQISEMTIDDPIIKVACISNMLEKYSNRKNSKAIIWKTQYLYRSMIEKIIEISNTCVYLYELKHYRYAFNAIISYPQFFQYMPEYQRYSLSFINDIEHNLMSLEAWCESIDRFNIETPDPNIVRSDMTFLPISTVPDSIMVSAMIHCVIGDINAHGNMEIKKTLKNNHIFCQAIDKLSHIDLIRFGLFKIII